MTSVGVSSGFHVCRLRRRGPPSMVVEASPQPGVVRTAATRYASSRERTASCTAALCRCSSQVTSSAPVS